MLEELLESHGHSVIPFAAHSENNRPTPWAEYFPTGVDTKNPEIGDIKRFVYSVEARNNMERLLEEAPKIDLAHLHIYYGQLSASILEPLKRAGVPIVQSLHDYKLTCPVYSHVSNGEACEACGGKHFWKALPRRCNQDSLSRTALSVLESYVSRALGDNREIDHFIAVSNFLRRKMTEHRVVAPTDISTVHNFVDANKFEPATEQGNYIFYFGRLESIKGVETLIEAMRPLSDIDLYLAGEGSLRGPMEKQIQEEKLNHIHFIGFQSGSELYDWVRGSVCTVLPSECYEICPMTVLESYACARPVIGAEIGGIPELVSEGEDGFLFPSGNVEGLRDRIVQMIDHRHRAVEMGRIGRKKIEDRFGPETHYTKIKNIYKGIL